MSQTEQQVADGSFIPIVADWVEDLMEQQVPGSVVLLIVLALLAPSAIRAVLALWSRKRK